MKRFVVEELLDTNAGTPEEVQRSLDDLGGVNRWLGGDSFHQRLVARAAAGTSGPLSVLEVAAGRATALQAALLPLQRQGRELTIHLLDAAADHLPTASHWNPALPAPICIRGNALNLPFENGSIDIVSTCLFLHHLEPAEWAIFFREALRVARVAVIFNEPERSRGNWLLACMGRFVFRSRISTHDSKASVRRAYTLEETRQILSATGFPFEVQRHRCYRVGGVVWKNPPPAAAQA